jgi:hypothetical protein|tara:strand:+ start:442 stop:645 length:204 start_codon:yes stop_codon:yes gene_type:complete
MEDFDKLIKLQDEYLKLHPNSEVPDISFPGGDIGKLIEMLENANGRKIEVIEDSGAFDLVEYKYIEN